MTTNPSRRRRGLLTELSERQEEARSILQNLMDDPDKTFQGGLIASFPDEEALVAVAVIMVELSREDRMPSEVDLVWAMEFLDHLDTLGKRIANKKL